MEFLILNLMILALYYIPMIIFNHLLLMSITHFQWPVLTIPIFGFNIFLAWLLINPLFDLELALQSVFIFFYALFAFSISVIIYIKVNFKEIVNG